MFRFLLLFFWVNINASNLTWSPFTENKGQMKDINDSPVPFVLFKASSGNIDLYLTNTGFTYVFHSFMNPSSNGSNNDFKVSPNDNPLQNYGWERMDIVLEGANITTENIQKSRAQPGELRYFLPHCPDGIKKVKSFKELTLKNVYDGIDWEFSISDKGILKYQFIVQPGADPNQIKLLLKGAGKGAISDNRIHLKLPHNELQEGVLYVYEETTGRTIQASYQVSDQLVNVYSDHSRQIINNKHLAQLIKINVGTYNAAYPLVIDPVLDWCTFYGGKERDNNFSIVSNDIGDIYYCGTTRSTNWPTVDNGTYFQDTLGGPLTGFEAYDMFIAKISEDGVPEWMTYYGGNKGDTAINMAIDKNRNLFVVGVTKSPNFPIEITGGSYSSPPAGISAATIIKFDENGDRIWAGVHCGNDRDIAYDVTIDELNNVFVVGASTSTNLFANDIGGYFDNTNNGGLDGFILKLNNNGQHIWSSYFGGESNDELYTISINDNGDIYACGYTWSDNGIYNANPNPNGYIRGSRTDDDDGLIIKFDENTNLLWSDYYGGIWSDKIHDSKIDLKDNLIITGRTAATSLFPAVEAPFPAYYQDQTVDGRSEPFIGKLDEADSLVWSTMYGKSGGVTGFWDNYDVLHIDQCNNYFISYDQSDEEEFPVIADAICTENFTQNYPGPLDGGSVIARFSELGEPTWSTFFNKTANCDGAATEITNGYLFHSQVSFMFGDAVQSDYPFKPNLVTNSINDTILPGGAFNQGNLIARFSLGTQAICNIYDSTICYNQTVSLSSPYKGEQYIWSTGDIDSTIDINIVSDSVIALHIMKNCYDTNTVVWNFKTFVPPNPIVDTTICKDQPTVLTAPQDTIAGLYEWSNGSNSQSIELTSTKDTSLYVLYGACRDSITYYISVPADSIFTDTLVCGIDSITLRSPVSSNYTWSTGETSQEITIPTDTATKVLLDYISKNGCEVVETFNIQVISDDTSQTDTTICAGDYVALATEFFGRFLWNTGDTTSSIKVNPKSTANYTLEILVNEQCKKVNSYQVNVSSDNNCLAAKYFIPNAMTTNGNDFHVTPISHIDSYELSIYDRYNNRIFFSTNPNQSWDGSTRGEKVAAGVYIYKLMINDQLISNTLTVLTSN